MNVRTIVIWGLSVVLSLVFAVSGFGKVYDPSGTMAANFQGWGLGAQVMLLVGVVEILGALLLLVPRLAAAAGGGLIIVMIGAIVTHLGNFETLGPPFFPLGVAVGLAVVVWLRVRAR